jgi:hypothetical protein
MPISRSKSFNREIAGFVPQSDCQTQFILCRNGGYRLFVSRLPHQRHKATDNFS